MISLEKLITKIDYLPPFSPTAQKAIQLLKNDNFRIKELVDIIKYDTSLTANLLKVANSALFAHSREINNITTAINYLGRKQIQSIVTISAAKHYFQYKLDGYEENPGELWEHNLAVSIISRSLLKYEPEVDENDLFTAGLLHDIGKIILSSFVADEFKQMNELMSKKQIDFITAEKEIIGYTHPEIGAAVLKKWNFSRELVYVTRYHHEPDHWNTPLIRLVCLAEYIALLMGKVSQKDALAYTGYEALMEYYKIRNNELSLLISETFDKVSKILASFNEMTR